MGKLFEELKRRKVFRVAALYAVVAWLLIQVVGEVLPAFEAPLWVTRVIIISLAMGFPVALVLAWLFSLTPDGIEGDSSSDSGSERSLQYLAIGIVVFISFAGVFVYLNLNPELGKNTDQVAEVIESDIEKSIAVLPFVSLGSGEEDGYFADGLTEELLSRLSQLSGLKVAARTSSYYYKERDVDIREIGENLGVRHVLEGSVRRNGDQLRITAQLVDVENGFQL